jgi:lipoprotein NlpD
LAALGLAACQQSVVVRPVEGPASRAESTRPSAGSTTSGRRYEVVSGDTLYKIAMQYGLDYREIARWNGIEAPYTIYPRQQLRLDPPGSVPASGDPATAVATAPVATAPVPSAPRPSGRVEQLGGAVAVAPSSGAQSAPAASPGYDPKLGVTLPEGAQPIGSAAVAAAPAGSPAIPSPPPEPSSRPVAAPAASSADLPDPGRLEMARPSSPAATAPLNDGVAAATAPANAVAPAPADTPAASSPTPAGPAPKPSAAGWIWPTTGQVVVTYAAGDPTRQGIRISGSAGQPVLAARDGEVVYSGSGLIGYGELIIVKHSPELLSAYGHNRVRLVKEGQKVKAGEKIAEMGATPANRVLLHFEIRRNGKPVDPLPLLPAR